MELTDPVSKLSFMQNQEMFPIVSITIKLLDDKACCLNHFSHVWEIKSLWSLNARKMQITLNCLQGMHVYIHPRFQVQGVIVRSAVETDVTWVQGNADLERCTKKPLVLQALLLMSPSTGNGWYKNYSQEKLLHTKYCANDFREYTGVLS